MKKVLFTAGAGLIVASIYFEWAQHATGAIVLLGLIAAVVFLTVGGIATLLDSEWWGRKRVKIAWTLRKMYMMERNQINNI